MPWAQGVAGSNPVAPTTFAPAVCNEIATGGRGDSVAPSFVKVGALYANDLHARLSLKKPADSRPYGADPARYELKDFMSRWTEREACDDLDQQSQKQYLPVANCQPFGRVCRKLQPDVKVALLLGIEVLRSYEIIFNFTEPFQ